MTSKKSLGAITGLMMLISGSFTCDSYSEKRRFMWEFVFLLWMKKVDEGGL